MPPELQREESLGEIVSRLVDDAKDYVRAEVELVRQTALAKVAGLRVAAIFLVCALLLLQAGLTVLAGALGMTLAIWLGAAGGLAVGALLVLLAAGLLAWLGIRRIGGGGG